MKTFNILVNTLLRQSLKFLSRESSRFGFMVILLFSCFFFICATLEGKSQSHRLLQDCEIIGESEERYFACYGEKVQDNSEEDAKEKSKSKALYYMASHFQITIFGSSTHLEVSKNLKYEYELRSVEGTFVKPIPMKYIHSEVVYSKQEGRKWSVQVRAILSKTEYERIKKEIEAEELKRSQMTDEEKAYEVAKNAMSQTAKTAVERDEVVKVLQNYLADYEDEDPKHTEKVRNRLDELGYEPVKKAMMKDSKALRYSGISLMVLGAAVAIGGITGFCIEFERNHDKYRGMLNESSADNAINNEEGKASYLNRAERYREKSNLYKNLAITSGVVGGVIAITGITLTALGVKKRNEYMNKRKNKNVFLMPTDRGFYASLSLDF